MINAYEQTWKSIVKPMSFPYEIEDLGPPLTVHPQKPKISLEKEEITITNKKGQQIKGSFFHQEKKENSKCVIYCHSHSANRVEGISIMTYVLPSFNFCIFDFTGCGHSGGEWVTLGAKEKDDLAEVIHFLANRKNQTDFYLWGRSMGAVASILFLDGLRNGGSEIVKNLAKSKIKIKGLILDSPFSSVKEMVRFST